MKLIRLLQKQHLPLAEIAERLKGLTDQQVRELLDETKARRASQGGSALDYIRNVLQDQSAKRSDAPDTMPAFLRRDGGAMPRGLGGGGRIVAGRRRRRFHRTIPSQWERYTLTDGIELNVRRPLARSEQRMLTRLLDAARRIFHTGEEE